MAVVRCSGADDFAAAAHAHLDAAVARAFHGAAPLTAGERARAFADGLLVRLGVGPDGLPLIHGGGGGAGVGSDAVAKMAGLFDSRHSPVPVVVTCPPRSGKSCLLAASIRAYTAVID